MDSWQVAQNYVVAAAVGGAIGGYYYYTSKQRKPNRTGSANAITPRRSETDLRGRNARRNTHDTLDKSADGTSSSRQTSSNAARKRKTRAEAPQVKQQPALDVIVDDKPTKEADMSAAQFANQMVQARQGTNLQSTKSKDTRVKTVKPRAATNTASTFEEEPSSTSAGDVSDMLEPVAPGPSTIRITAPTEPQKVKPQRQAKQELVETKKQRQNRKKNEERKALRDEAEAERKVLEERQRRTAREARGEPAKNGITQAPVHNPWEQRNANTAAAVQAADVNGTHGVMLDTFDAESTSSSNGGPGVSTAATSTTSGEPQRWDGSSEEEQMAAAIQQSHDESGWTTVSAPAKKSKKQANGQASGAITPVKESGKGMASTGAYAALGDADWDA